MDLDWLQKQGELGWTPKGVRSASWPEPAALPVKYGGALLLYVEICTLGGVLGQLGDALRFSNNRGRSVRVALIRSSTLARTLEHLVSTIRRGAPRHGILVMAFDGDQEDCSEVVATLDVEPYGFKADLEDDL